MIPQFTLGEGRAVWAIRGAALTGEGVDGGTEPTGRVRV